MLKIMGFTAGVSAAAPPVARSAQKTNESLSGIDYIKPDRPVTAIIVGAGRRGGVYASYAVKHPDEWKVVGVAEPLPFRNEAYARKYNIPKENRFVTWEDVFDRPKFADVVVISTQDALHYGPAMAALEKGYDLLLEKPIAQSWRECHDILKLAQKKGSIVGVGHVLRYAPYFQHMHNIVASGALGDLVHVEHMEPVGYIHFSHSYVRGPWGNTGRATPILLSKSCHDLDILRWIVGKPCNRVSSFGSRKMFCAEGAPKGAGKRCTECAIESQCPFSAVRIYVREKKWATWHFYLEKTNDDTLMEALKTGQYGRCVYHTDNDALESQTVNMMFDDNINVSFSVVGPSPYGGRRTRIFGTKGNIVGDNETMTIYGMDSNSGKPWNPNDAGITIRSGHYGGDAGIVGDLVQAVSRKDASLLASRLEDSMESHFIGFKAEESRLSGGKPLHVKMPT